MEERHQLSLTEVSLGEVVQVMVDARDRSRSNPALPIGVVYRINSYSSDKIKTFSVVTEHGVMTVGSQKKTGLSLDKLKTYKTQPAVSEKINKLRQQVLIGTFSDKSVKKISIANAHKLDIGTATYGRTTCKCLSGCKTNTCGCRKRGSPCGSGCHCNKQGGCQNTEKHHQLAQM
jgi:hypothetical protein